MALAVALAEGYAPAAAAEAESGAEDAWRAYLSALDAAAPTPARVAAACRATPEFVDSLPEKARREIASRRVWAATAAGRRAPELRGGEGRPRTRARRGRRSTVLDAATAHATVPPRVPRRVQRRVPRSASRASRARERARRGDGATPERATTCVAAAVAALEVLASRRRTSTRAKRLRSGAASAAEAPSW